MLFNEFFNFVLVCKDIEPRCGRTRTRDFFSTVTRVVSFTTISFTTVYFTYPCNLIFSSLKLENGLRKHVRNVARIKYRLFEIVVIL